MCQENVRIELECEVVNVVGTGHLEAISVDAPFVFIGAEAKTAWLPSALTRDKLGKRLIPIQLSELSTNRVERYLKALRPLAASYQRLKQRRLIAS